MLKYKREEEGKTQKITSFFNSHISNRLRRKGILDRPTDLAFAFSCDAYTAIGGKTKRKPHSVSPMLLFCYNIEPGVRHKQWNVIVVGLVPGPKAPKRLDTFMIPIIREFKRLSSGNGILVWNEFLQKEVWTRSFLTALISDMKAREAMIITLGNRAKSYCEFCEIIGLAKAARGRGPIYCPIHAPVHNVPPEVYQREEG